MEKAARRRHFTARRDEPPADDWDVQPGRVSSRVALLLRAAERQPALAAFVKSFFDLSFPHESARSGGHLEGFGERMGPCLGHVISYKAKEPGRPLPPHLEPL